MDYRTRLSFIALTSYTLLFIITFFSVVQPLLAEKRYREACNSHKECETQHCHRTKKTCECWTLKDSNGKQLDQFYDNDLRMCLSRVGQLCTLESANHNDLAPFRCLPDASCIVSKEHISLKISTQLFGSCNCKLGYQPTESGRRCISNAELRTVQAPASMDQIRPEGWDRSGSNSVILTGVSYIFSLSITFSVLLGRMFPFR